MWILLALIIVSVFTHFTSTTTFANIEKRNDGITEDIFDYDCGNAFFSNEVVQNTALDGWKFLPKMFRYPMVFKASFYDKRLDLMIWPIKKDGQAYCMKNGSPGIHFIVIDWMGEVKDVVVKTMSSQFIKCTKIRKSPLVPSNDTPQKKTDGYDCGYSFFEDQLLLDVVAEASLRIRNNVQIYDDNKIVDSESNSIHYLWPISKTKDSKLVIWSKSIFFVKFNLDGELKDVKIKLVDGFLFTCPRALLSERLPENEEDESPEESGYQCGIYFYSMRYLNRSAMFSKRPQTTTYKKIFPLHYNGPPFNTDVYLYPIIPGNRVYFKGMVWNHFEVMNRLYEVITVVIKSKNGYHLCEERTRSTETMIETSDFKCGSDEFPHDQLVETAKKAFESLGISKSKFPANYEGPDFDIPGPYITWPLTPKNYVRNGSNRFRIVLNERFQIAGVIFRYYGRFQKCKRASDNSIPGGGLTEFISERSRNLC